MFSVLSCLGHGSLSLQSKPKTELGTRKWVIVVTGLSVCFFFFFVVVAFVFCFLTNIEDFGTLEEKGS